MYSKLLSIIVPVYNSEQYLKDCIDSLLNQDVDHNKYEIICVDDGSTDKSFKIIKEYEASNGIVVCHQKNGGASSARNLGLSKAKGLYVWFVDSDDMIRPNCLKTIFSILENHSPDSIYIRILFGYDDFVWDLNNSLTYVKEDNKYLVSAICEAIVSNKIIKENHIRLDTNLVCGEDQMFHLMFHVKSYGSVFSIKEGVYYYRQRDNSVIHSATSERRLIDSLQMALLIKEQLNTYDKKTNYMLNQKMIFMTWNVLYFLPKTNFNRKEIFLRLKQNGLKIPFLWSIPEKRKSFEWRCKKFISRFFSIKPFYFLYYYFTKKKNKGANSK